MNKMNKKGFTLIEMLVVIAIIAILVSIIIPTVTSATDKAAAATNAANLRSVKAEATTNLLLTGNVGTTSTPASKKVDSLGCAAGQAPTVTPNSDGSVTVTYGDLTIEDFAAAAEGRDAVNSGGGSNGGGSNGGGTNVTCTSHTNNGSNGCTTPGCTATYTPARTEEQDVCDCESSRNCTCSGHTHERTQNGCGHKEEVVVAEGYWS